MCESSKTENYYTMCWRHGDGGLFVAYGFRDLDTRTLVISSSMLYKVCVMLGKDGMNKCFDYWMEAYNVLFVLEQEERAEIKKREEAGLFLKKLMHSMTAPVGAPFASAFTPILPTMRST